MFQGVILPSNPLLAFAEIFGDANGPVGSCGTCDSVGKAGLRARPLDDDGAVVDKSKALLTTARSTAPRGTSLQKPQPSQSGKLLGESV